MQTDTIDAVGIDGSGSLWIKPATATFAYIYREAMEVQWNAEQGGLFTPKPREWTYVDWFRQIVAAARELGVELVIGPMTAWSDIDVTLREAISANPPFDSDA